MGDETLVFKHRRRDGERIAPTLDTVSEGRSNSTSLNARYFRLCVDASRPSELVTDFLPLLKHQIYFSLLTINSSLPEFSEMPFLDKFKHSRPDIMDTRMRLRRVLKESKK